MIRKSNPNTATKGATVATVAAMSLTARIAEVRILHTCNRHPYGLLRLETVDGQALPGSAMIFPGEWVTFRRLVTVGATVVLAGQVCQPDPGRPPVLYVTSVIGQDVTAVGDAA
ncbi:hypothetical protein GCM10022223_47000 [Kineosporia mesophila]|uniref:Uncharacterized protein n=1 Tax=Kineosporia mesophila TaxID=566012 RepID=A0ABP7A401_9ACTN|nr:hypothetical protein [Kineosporia mesophila]MCD5353808.1 hypothetical protein [Kineosporia mesophila]